MEDDVAFGALAGVDQIAALLNRKYGIDFSQYKAGTVGRRIGRRMGLLGLDAMEAYVARLSKDEVELSLLYEDLLIGVTKFFRDPEAFEALGRQVITPLVQSTKGDSIRIWVAACASGEEAYSIAILVDEAMRKSDRQLEIKVFATDAHSGSLQIAAKGIYPEDVLVDMSGSRRKRYFTRASDGYHINRSLRNLVVFASHNLINDAPFTQMDLVTCRNMLIYLQPGAQSKALGMFHFALKPKGFMFLGPSESPGTLSEEFKSIDSRWRIYSKRRDIRLPLAARAPMGKRLERLPYITSTKSQSRNSRVDQDIIDTYDQLLSKMMPSSILVTESGDILHVFGGADRFLKGRGGRPSNHLLEVIADSLKTSVSVTFHHAVKKSEPVRNASTTFDGPNGMEDIRITVSPMSDGKSGPNNFLIEIAATGSPVQAVEATDATNNEMHQTRVEGLETELRFSQENLQAALEEMESSNEELQASNEELVASNEELQSTNEELHSVNEELYTVNAEHQRRVEELAIANDDMDNLLATTRVGVIFLDKDLYIRRFTPEIARVFHLTSQDTGRSMENFANVLNHKNLTAELHQVVHTRSELEIKVTDRNGTHYLLRVMPYRSGDTTEGLVLTLIDITSLVNAEAEIHLQKMAIESAINGIVITDPFQEDDPIVYANQGFLDLTGYEREEVVGRNCRFLQCDESAPDAKEKIREALKLGNSVRVALLNRRKNGEPFWNDLSITPVRSAEGRITHFVGVQHDVTIQVEAQAKLEEANRTIQEASDAKSSFLATMSHELRTPLTAVLGFADILRNESNAPDYISKIDTIRRNGQYLLALLNDILDLSKIEAGKLEFGKQGVDIRSVLSEVETLMQIRATEAGIPLRFDLQSPLPAVINADEVRVRQILVNLISNAIKFANGGEVIVAAKTTDDCASSNACTHLQISVTDSGIGISKSQLDKLFVPFNKAPNQTVHHAGGSGLGLSISKRLAEGMGGKIDIESKLGQGSCFTLCLPVTDEQARNVLTNNITQPNSTKATAADTFPRIDAKILLADDRRDIWQVGKHFLEQCDASVTIAENGKQAVELVDLASREGHPFALILMDMQMPIMSGKEAVAKIRELGYKTPIIALTADAMDGERESCIAMGCDEYFPKPIDGLSLTKLIAKMLSRS